MDLLTQSLKLGININQSVLMWRAGSILNISSSADRIHTILMLWPWIVHTWQHAKGIILHLHYLTKIEVVLSVHVCTHIMNQACIHGHSQVLHVEAHDDSTS